MRRTLVLAAASFGALAAAVLGQDGDGQKLRLDAWFGAKDADARKKALDALDGVAVPKDMKGRIDAVRRAVPVPARKSASRITEKLLDRDCFFVTPKGYDPKKLFSSVVSFHGREGNGHHGIQAFAYPDEEFEEFKKPIEEEAHKKYGANAKVKIENPKSKLVKIAFDDGIVIGPTIQKQDLDAEEVDEVTLAALERLLRAYGADPDRILVAGISLGGAAACQLAERHPDRFAGLVAVAGYDPNDVENLRPLQAYLAHGAKDDDVPVAAGRNMDALLTAANVKHLYKENPTGGHAWPLPEECAKIRTWMRERKREPWPKEVAHRFVATKDRRCFWVELPADPQARPRSARVDAKCENNEIDLDVQGASGAILHLGEPLVDLEKEVVVRWKTREVFRGKLARSWRDLLADVDATGFDLPRAAPARLEVKAP